MPLLAFSAHDLDAAGLEVDAALPQAWIDHELGDASVQATAPGHVAARLSRSGADVVVRGRVKASLTTPCARCCEPAPFEVDTELSLLLKAVTPSPRAGLKPGASPTPNRVRAAEARKALEPKTKGKERKESNEKEVEVEFTADDAEVDTYDGETVVLDSFVREAMLLEAPNFPLCSDACPGIAAALAPAARQLSNGSVDPRLAPLDALRSELARKAASAPAAQPTPATQAGQAKQGPPAPKKKKNKE